MSTTATEPRRAHAVQDRVSRTIERMSRWRPGPGPQVGIALAVYSGAALLLFGLPVLGHFASRFVGRPTSDSYLFLWSLGWWPHAVGHALNPFFTKVVWAPTGYNLAWATTIPGPSLVLWPLTRAFGPAASYNLLALLSPALSAWTAFVLCRRVTQRFWPSLVGGYVFGFSTYELGHLRGHPNLSVVFLVPVCAYLLLRRFDGTLSTRAFVPLMALALVGEFSVSIEVFATMTLFGAVTLAIAMLLSSPAGRRRLLSTVGWLGVAYVVTGAVVSPYLYAMAAYPTPFRVVPVHFVRASTDLANLVIPNSVTALGNGSFRDIAVHFARPLPVGGSYIGIILLAVLLHFAWSARRTMVGKLLIATFLVILLFSLGPVLKLSGPTGVPMPWKLFMKLPLIHRALPGRFMMYGFLVLAVVVAIWVTVGGRLAWARWLVAAAGAVLLLPNLGLSFAAKAEPPPFFAEGLYRRVLSPGEMVVPSAIPVARSMLYQAETGMYFRIPAGYFGSSPPGVAQRRIARAVTTGHPPLFQAPMVRKFLVSKGVGAILVITGRPFRIEEWKRFLRFLHVRPVRLGGVTVYRLPHP